MRDGRGLKQKLEPREKRLHGVFFKKKNYMRCFTKKNFSRSFRKSPNSGPTHIQWHLHPYPYETGRL